MMLAKGIIDAWDRDGATARCLIADIADLGSAGLHDDEGSHASHGSRMVCAQPRKSSLILTPNASARILSWSSVMVLMMPAPFALR